MAVQKTAAGKRADASKTKSDAASGGAGKPAKEAKAGMSSCKKLTYLVLFLVVGFLAYVFLDEGEIEGQTVVGPGGLLKGEDLYFQYDTDKIPMNAFTEKIPDWKTRPWTDIYVPEIQIDEFWKTLEDTKDGPPMGVFFYDVTSDYHRFDIKRFWSKSSKLFKEKYGRTMHFYRMKLGDNLREGPRYDFKHDLLEHGLNPSGIQASLFLFVGGDIEYTVKLPLRGSSVELMEDLDFLMQPRSREIIEHDVAKKLNGTGGIHQNLLRPFKDDVFTRHDHRVFLFTKPGEYEEVDSRMKFTDARFQAFYDAVHLDMMGYALYHTSNLDHLKDLDEVINPRTGEVVPHSDIKPGDMVYHRLLDARSLLVPRELSKAEEIKGWIDDVMIPPPPVVLENTDHMLAVNFKLQEMANEDPKYVFIKLMYSFGQEKKVRKIGMKILEACKEDPILFPYIVMESKKRYNLDAQIHKLPDMKNFKNFMSLHTGYLQPSAEIVQEELNSVFAIEKVKDTLERAKAYIEKMGDDFDEEFGN